MKTLVTSILAYAAFAAGIGYFSVAPPYQRLAPGQAVLKFALTHAGARVEPCHERTAEELAKLPPNMRSKQSCSRERHPVWVELELDGRTVISASAPPAGLSRDGASRHYVRLNLPAGPHSLTVRMRDSGRTEGYDHQLAAEVTLEPRQILAIDFDDQTKSLMLR
ncbi:MAG: hypothetical protein HQL40_05170 [Alphaproteobacteria bacterium]|nr:hypothetical protein [Alphaproteobacteria bacterium]